MGKIDKLQEIRAAKRAIAAKVKLAEELAGGQNVAKVRGLEHSAKMAMRSREQCAALSEIGPLPPVKDPERKERCRFNLFAFLTEYFPASTGLKPFSNDHRTVIAEIQACVLDGGRRINAVYREFAKTTISENTIIWASNYGHRLFSLITGQNKAASTANIESIKSEYAENDLLLEDFPEVCFPIREGSFQQKPQRAKSQTCGGKYTRCIWRADEIVLPTIEGSPASGVIIVSKPFARARGVKFKRADGVNARPDLILVDDPQDDEEAASAKQVKKNLGILRKTLTHATTHTKQAAIIVNGTVIAKDDMIDALLVDPAYHGERIKFVQSWSKHHDEFWLKEYATARRSFNRAIKGDMERAHREATALYLSKREFADEGCAVSWIERYSPPHEVSAIQHAYNVLIDDGLEVFQSEYQNEPLDERTKNSNLTAAMVASKTNGLARFVAPKNAEHITAYVDVHLKLLYYVVTAWASDMTGAVVDYGTYPRQPVSYFSQNNPPVTMADVAQRDGAVTEDAWIYAGLVSLFNELLVAKYRREDGAEMQIGKALVDAHWSEKTELVYSFCRRHPRYPAIVFPSHGYGSSATKPHLNALPLKPGTQQGTGWRIAPLANGATDRWVTIDTNFWKSFVCSRLAMPLASLGGIEIFGMDPREHSLFADHCVAESPVDISAQSEKTTTNLTVWQWLLPHQDNHWWDCLCGSAVAASILGCATPQWQSIPAQKTLSMKELAARAKRGR